MTVYPSLRFSEEVRVQLQLHSGRGPTVVPGPTRQIKPESSGRAITARPLEYMLWQLYIYVTQSGYESAGWIRIGPVESAPLVTTSPMAPPSY